jgi:hypothetical protein
MDFLTLRRGTLALAGALAGAGLWLLDEAGLRGMLADRPHFLLAAWGVIFFAAVLAMTGPMPMRRAVAVGAPFAAVVAVLLLVASLRYDLVAQFQFADLSFAAAAVLVFVAMPVLIAAQGPGWRDYPTLFAESWMLVVRAATAVVFTGLIWGLIWLADALLGLVGLGVMGWLMGEGGPVARMLTGAALGLGFAVAGENTDLLAPDLILRLLRPLALPLLVVEAVFLLALPMRGLSGLPEGLSAAGLLLGLAAAAAALVSVVVEREEALADPGRITGLAARGLALLMPVPVGLAGWALWLRVAQHGWTPGRLFAAVLVVLAAGYAAQYLLAALRGAAWRGAVRRANVAMAVAVMAAAVLWLSPVLNAEAISARSQLARFEAEAVDAGVMDFAALDRWGVAGARAMARLDEMAVEPGREVLAAALAVHRGAKAASEDPVVMAERTEAVLVELRAVMPLQPATATATRDMLLAGVPAVELQSWLEACREPLPGGARPGCVFVVADLWRDAPGEEAVVLLREMSGFVRYEGLGLTGGVLQRRSVASMAGALPDREAGVALIETLQDAPPPVEVAPLSVLGVNGGLLLLP